MKRKVLIVVQNNAFPFDDRVRKEALSLRNAGYQVSVLCPRGKGAEKSYELVEGIHVYRHPAPEEGNGALAYIWEYGCSLLWEVIYSWWIYLRRGFDVMQGCNPPDNIFLVALPFKLFGVGYIFDHHDVSPELYLSKYGKKDFFYRIQTWLEKMTFRCADIVMSTNLTYKGVAVDRGGVNPSDTFIVRNGPDLDTFKPVSPNPAVRYGKRYLVGYVGVMSVQEGLDILLDVAEHIKSMGRTDVHFTCVGGGPALAGLRRMTEERDLGDVVNFTGRVPFAQLMEVLSTADVCVNPDKPCEMNDMSTMIKIMEYMALGKPIVQFDLKEGRFSAQEASLYSDNGNQVADFADKILWLLDHPEERARMGEFGRKRVQEGLAWEYSIPMLLAAYERAFSKAHRKRALRTDPAKSS